MSFILRVNGIEVEVRRPLLILAEGFRVDLDTDDGYRVVRGDGLYVIVSEAKEMDGRWWRHVSFSFPDRLPTWADARLVKDTFIGEGRKAIQVFPPASEHVNIHPYCLHLFWCCDGDVLPDFTHGSGTL